MEGLVDWFSARVVFWIPLVLSLSVHEYAHALAASWLGDTTSESQGRLTLDPAAHADPIGTVILPLLSVPFGWARPVPVNPANFRGGGDGRLGMLLTAAAGPAANVLIAILCTLALGVLHVVAPGVALGRAGHVLASTTLLNVTLAVFNLLPIPPLDGSRVVDFVCPDALRPAWSWIYARGGLGIALLFGASLLLGIDLVGWSRDLGQWLVNQALG